MFFKRTEMISLKALGRSYTAYRVAKLIELFFFTVLARLSVITGETLSRQLCDAIEEIDRERGGGDSGSVINTVVYILFDVSVISSSSYFVFHLC